MGVSYSLFGYKVTDIEPLISPEEQWKLGEMSLYLVGVAYFINFAIMIIATVQKIRWAYRKLK